MRLKLLLAFIVVAVSASAQAEVQSGDNDGFRLVELKVDTLPGLNIARSGHTTLCLDGELTVFGGHTDGFVPTATAEYFRDGAWHTVPLIYPHDHAAVLQLRSGKVFLAGGHKEPLGIGQLFSAELYDPEAHASQGFGCMEQKRVYPNALEMADGQVVISGNWYADDDIEMFADIYDPTMPNAVKVKDTSFARSTPYILRIAEDDAIIFSSLDNKAEPVDCGIVDRLNGPSYREPFLDTWHPFRTINNHRSTNHFIGDEAEGRYEWLIPVENIEAAEIAIARVKATPDADTVAEFSLLPTQRPIPPSINGKNIVYTSLICDREREMAYLVGDDGDDAHIFVVAIPYNDPDGAPLTIYATEPQTIKARETTPALIPEGDLVFAGGNLINNFAPSNTVVRLPLGNGDVSTTATATAESGSRAWWLWIIIALMLVGIVTIILRRKKSDGEPDIEEENIPKDDGLAELFKRIERLMEEEQLFLNPNLRASDVAVGVGSNTAYVSAAINSQRGCSFTQFLTDYRISYAKELMRLNPESKISIISAQSGFSTDSTFFRVFRASTGMSPKEWLATIHPDQKTS